MRLQKVISNISAEQLNIGPYRMVRISHSKYIQNLDPSSIDGIFVDNISCLKEVLMNDDLYLKPLFYLGITNRQCDGSHNDINDPSIIGKIKVILQKINAYENLPLPTERKERLLTKIARYLISRNSSINPLNSRNSKIGYCYPLIEDLSIESDPLHIIKHLNQYTTEDYFQSKITDKVNVCYECQGSFLNFSECCTKCNSLDLTSEELVHHFRCAYVGPQSDFMKDEKMICPKCDHQLKHIGIDYDKPSEIHTCKSCNHSSQETKMKAKCVDCCKENELDQLSTFEICKYEPTEKLKSFATQSVQKSDFGDMQSSPSSEFLNMGAYNLLKSHESRRASSLNMAPYEMIISIDNVLLAQLNHGMQKALTEELSMIIKPYLKDTDLIAVDNHKNIKILLIDYESDSEQKLVDVLHYNLNKMLVDNGWSDNQPINISLNSIKS